MGVCSSAGFGSTTSFWPIRRGCRLARGWARGFEARRVRHRRQIAASGRRILSRSPAPGPVVVSDRQNVTTWSATSSEEVPCGRTALCRAPSRTASGKRPAHPGCLRSKPGATQLTSTLGASATARHLVRWINPALVVE